VQFTTGVLGLVAKNILREPDIFSRKCSRKLYSRTNVDDEIAGFYKEIGKTLL